MNDVNQTSENTETSQPPVVTDSTARETRSDQKIEFTETTIMAALSYLWILVFIPFLTKRNDTYIMYHVKQGLVLFGLGVIVWVIGMFMWFLSSLLNLALLVLAIIGIINALRHEEKPLPLVGHWTNQIKL
jgi:uncharacterized membrane protein